MMRRCVMDGAAEAPGFSGAAPACIRNVLLKRGRGRTASVARALHPPSRREAASLVRPSTPVPLTGRPGCL